MKKMRGQIHYLLFSLLVLNVALTGCSSDKKKIQRQIWLPVSLPRPILFVRVYTGILWMAIFRVRR